MPRMGPDIYSVSHKWQLSLWMTVLANVIIFLKIKWRCTNTLMRQVTTLRTVHSRLFSITEFLVRTESYLEVPPCFTVAYRVALVQEGMGASRLTTPLQSPTAPERATAGSKC